MSGFTRQSRPVCRTPHPLVTCFGTDSTVSGGSWASKSGVPLPIGEASLARPAAEHAAHFVGAGAAGRGQVSGPPQAVVGTVGIQAAETGQVVHGSAPVGRSSGGSPK